MTAPDVVDVEPGHNPLCYVCRGIDENAAMTVRYCRDCREPIESGAVCPACRRARARARLLGVTP